MSKRYPLPTVAAWCELCGHPFTHDPNHDTHPEKQRLCNNCWAGMVRWLRRYAPDTDVIHHDHIESWLTYARSVHAKNKKATSEGAGAAGF